MPAARDRNRTVVCDCRLCCRKERAQRYVNNSTRTRHRIRNGQQRITASGSANIIPMKEPPVASPELIDNSVGGHIEAFDEGRGIQETFVPLWTEEIFDYRNFN
ncbi:hypothetical protein RUND412_009055, partial [Rhizina undulata]